MERAVIKNRVLEMLKSEEFSLEIGCVGVIDSTVVYKVR